jgi:O-succinylhomoserine sulfhydrylase
MIENDEKLGFQTLALRTGHNRTAEQEHSEPLFMTSSFCFDSAEQAAKRFSGEEKGNVYSRFTNPTVRCFEERLAALEGGESCVATSSGMSAILSLVMSTLSHGDKIVASRSIFGTSVNLFEKILPRFGIETIFVDMTDLAAWSRAMCINTKMLFVETPSNPLTEIADIAALKNIAVEYNALLVVDNCFCTPALQRPIEHGADIVIHSATKFLDGQGRCVGGAIVGSTIFLEEKITPFLRSAGTCLSPFNAWIFLKGLETLHIRMEKHSANAALVAEWLHKNPLVKKTHYPGLEGHPQRNLCRIQQTAAGGIVSFDVGSRNKAWNIVDNLTLFSITANLGDSKSIVTHPATTTHGRVTADARKAMGVSDGMLRLSLGLEDSFDLIRDLDMAFQKI